MDIFKKLQELALPLGEYVVIGSGPLAALGLREAGDLDIVVTPRLFKELSDSGRYQEQIKHGQIFLVAEDVEIFTSLARDGYSTATAEAIRSAVIIKDFSFLNFTETIKFKQALGREKDRRDIKMLEDYLASR